MSSSRSGNGNGIWTPIRSIQRGGENRSYASVAATPILIELSSDSEGCEILESPSPIGNNGERVRRVSDQSTVEILDVNLDEAGGAEGVAGKHPPDKSRKDNNDCSSSSTGASSTDIVNDEEEVSSTTGVDPNEEEEDEDLNGSKPGIGIRPGSPAVSYITFFDPNKELDANANTDEEDQDENEMNVDVEGEETQPSIFTSSTSVNVEQVRKESSSDDEEESIVPSRSKGAKRKLISDKSESEHEGVNNSDDDDPKVGSSGTKAKRNRKRLSIQETSSSEELKSNNDDNDNDTVVSLQTTSTSQKVKVIMFGSSSSEGESPESDHREKHVVRKSKKNRKRSSRTRTPSSASISDSDTDSWAEDVFKTPTKRKLRKKKVKKNSAAKKEKKSKKSKKDKKNIEKKNLRTPEERNRKKTARDLALEKLAKKMEERKKKEAARKKEEPKKSKKVDSESESRSNSASESGSGSDSNSINSDNFVVPDDASGLSSFSTSTPSSSSASGETDEVPDLDSGSEGDANLPQDVGADDVDAGSDRTSSSSEQEPPDDGQNDERCLLCKQLGKVNVDGRVEQEPTDWCRCDHCDIFADYVGDYDLVCCKDIKGVREFMKEEMDDDDGSTCITEHPRFKSDVLENRGYARAISKGYNHGLRSGGGCAGYYEFTCANRAQRDRMYDSALARFNQSDVRDKYWKCLSSFRYWIYDKLDRISERIVVPACAVKKIRQELGIKRHYCHTFKTNFICQNGNGKHCGKTYYDYNNPPY